MQKRRKAPAPFKREGSPHYQYDFVVGGERFRGSTNLTSAREAAREVESIWNRVRDQVARGEIATDPTIEQVFTRHWTSHAHALGSAGSLLVQVRDILASVGARKPWRQVGNADVAKFVEERYKLGFRRWKGSGASKSLVRIRDIEPATVNRSIALWQAVSRRARDEWEYETRPIAWSMHREDEPDERVRAITVDEARRLLNELPRHIQWIVAFSLCTGVRRNEAFTLQWSRVDIANRQCHVIAKGKNGGTRPVSLNIEAMAIIGSQTAGSGDGLVFDSTNWRRHYALALDAAGIDDFRWHDLRHTFATWAGRAGVPLEVASKALGHSAIDVTMRYRHVFRDEVAGALEGIPALGVTNVDAALTQKSPHKVPTIDVQPQETRALKTK